MTLFRCFDYMLCVDQSLLLSLMQGYEAVSQKFISIRRVRGDNYCAVRATLFQALTQAVQLPDWLQNEDIMLVSLRFPALLLIRQSSGSFYLAGIYKWFMHQPLTLTIVSSLPEHYGKEVAPGDYACYLQAL